MILGYFIIGLVIAALGAAPLGASNIAVITTTGKESLSKSMHIAYGAGFGEVILAFLALCYSQILSDFFNMNPWIQLVFIISFLAIGIFFLLPNKPKIALKKSIKSPSKFFTGFLLAFANPPVLLFWILAISITHKYVLSVSDMSPITVLLLFFSGIYTGKVVTLYGYGKWSSKMAQTNGSKTKLYKGIGIALIAIAMAQGVRFLIN